MKVKNDTDLDPMSNRLSICAAVVVSCLIAGTAWGGGAPVGDACPYRFPDNGVFGDAFLDIGYWSCWACPTGYHRSLAPVTAPNGCFKAVSNKSAATHVGKYGCTNKYGDDAFFDPIDGGTCWTCPSGYNRTWTRVDAWDACATSLFGKKSVATRVGSYGCDDGRAFRDPIHGGTCWTCPDGYDRTWTRVDASDACLQSELRSPGRFRGYPSEPAENNCPPAPKIPDSTEVTFYVTGDLHFGKEEFTSDDLIRHVAEMNNLPMEERMWPAEFKAAGKLMTAPVGVVTTGDITQWGHDWQYNFLRWLYEYEVRTRRQYEAAIKWPVFLGLGNHDLDGDCHGNNCARRMFGYVKTRNGKGCMGVSAFDDGSHNYSWDWNKIHFVQLHKWAGDTRFGEHAKHTPGLAWLEKDLDAMESAHKGRAVVLFQHYGFDTFSREARWWSDDDRAAFKKAIAGHNVIAIFVGHRHTAGIDKFEGIDVLQTGTGGENGKGDFYVVRITDTTFDAAHLTWDTKDTKPAWYDSTIKLSKSITTQ